MALAVAYLPVTSRILPMCEDDSIIARARRACSSGKVAWISGFTKPLSKSGQIFSRKAVATSAFCCTLRARKVEPVKVRRRSMIGCKSKFSTVAD